MEPFKGDENNDTYLLHFERVVTLNEWRKESWAKKLAPLLQGPAREVYVRMTPSEAGDYEVLRKALLDRFRRNEDFYR
jgi:hypothetical protein